MYETGKEKEMRRKKGKEPRNQIDIDSY